MRAQNSRISLLLPNFLDPEPFDFLMQSQSISSIEVHPISSIGSHLSLA
jgi:hypothetical protein